MTIPSEPNAWRMSDSQLLTELGSRLTFHESLIAELVAALERIAHEPLGYPETNYTKIYDACVNIARTALAKVTP